MMNFLSVIWNFDPALIRIGDFEIRYYAVTWVLAFVVGMYVFNRILRREHRDTRLTDTLFVYAAVSTAIGARLGHCIFYDLDYFLAHPLEVFNFRGGGLASHGAAIGMLIGLWLFSRKERLPFMWTLDRMAVVIPVGGALVRFGNLLNSEVYGTPTDLPWGFVFLRAGETVPMHPTQIYEAVAYLLIFLLLVYMYFVRGAGKRPGLLFGTFLTLLFASRFLIENIKNPQEAFERTMALNMGQILSLPFIAAGIVILVLSFRKPNPFERKARKTVNVKKK